MIEIVRPDHRHLEAVTEFFRSIDVPEVKADFYPHAFTEARAKALCAYSGDDEYYIAWSGVRVIGYGMLRGWDEGYGTPSLGICIRPGHQGKGLGLAMASHLIAAAHLRGAKHVILKVKQTNAPAIGLYRRLGFRISALDKDFLRGLLVLQAS